MNRFGQILLTSLFLIFIFSVGIFLVFSTDKEVSNTENRALAQAPDFNLESVFKGDFMQDFDSYVTDQFPYRNKWLEYFMHYQRFTNQTFVHEYYITDDNWMLPEPLYGFPQEKLDTTAKKLNDFGTYLRDRNTEFYYFSVPHKVTLMQFLFPEYIERGDYLQNIQYLTDKLDEDKVVSLDLTTDYQNRYSEEDIKNFYFKTDHHWTMEGAFTAYKDIMGKMSEHSSHLEETIINKKNHTEKCANESAIFQGSYNVQIYMTVDAEDEKLCTYLPKDETFLNYEVTVNDKKIEPNALYGSAIYNQNLTEVNYNLLFASNYREIKIKNPNQKATGKKILILKDSYANPIIYHLAEHFYETVIYDPRYNEDRTVQAFIEENDFDIVAMIYNSTHIEGENYNFDTFPIADD